MNDLLQVPLLELSRTFKVVSLFSYQGPIACLRSKPMHNITGGSDCQTLFYSFLSCDERRRRDLNPRAAINDLHPFQGCPFGQLGYFSTIALLINKVYSITIPLPYPADIASGESGIRTHAPFRTNGFQDRLVMTTSISLQTCLHQSAQKLIYHFFILLSTKK